jgi:subfamily B ATP-binding cassette protein HlyB/CyaB
MNHDTDAPAAPDSGLACLLLVTRFHGLAAEPEPLRHQFATPGAPFGSGEILRAARSLGLKAREVASSPERLADTPLPAIAPCADGRFVVLAAVDRDRVLLHDPAQRAPTVLSRDEFLGLWAGRFILLARRAGAAGEEGPFGFRWFLPALLRYRRLFGEVVVASFFIQVLALVTPLFFQVVVDKVLVHRGLTTLDVLAVGLLVVALFEVGLGGLRTYLFAHTTNRVDVLLGARVFRHLLALPLCTSARGASATRSPGSASSSTSASS